VPKPKQGRISTYLAKEESEDDTIMRRSPNMGDEGREPMQSLIMPSSKTSAQKELALGVAEAGHRANPISLRPRIWRISTTPSSAIPKYFNKENWGPARGGPGRTGLHLLARRNRDFRIHAVASSMRPRRCRRTCCSPGTCSGLEHDRVRSDRECAGGIRGHPVAADRRKQLSNPEAQNVWYCSVRFFRPDTGRQDNNSRAPRMIGNLPSRRAFSCSFLAWDCLHWRQRRKTLALPWEATSYAVA